MFRYLTLTCLLLIGMAQTAQACNRCGLFGRRCVHQRHNVVQQQVVYAPPIYQQQYYFVGAPIRMEAIYEKMMQDFQRKAQQGACNHSQNFQQAPVPPGAQVLTTSILASKCATCHSPDGSMSKMRFDQPNLIDDGLRLKMLRAASSGRMPPEPHPPLTDEEYSQFEKELLFGTQGGVQ